MTPALWFVVVVSLIDPNSGFQTIYRDKDPFVQQADCVQIAHQLNLRFLREGKVGMSRCEGVTR